MASTALPIYEHSSSLSVSSGLVAPENINCYIAKDIGKKIMDESLRNKETFGEFKIQRSKRVKPISFTNTSVKVINDIIVVDTTRNSFSSNMDKGTEANS